MLSFLYSIFDTLLEWVGFKNESTNQSGLNAVLRESIHTHIENDKIYIDNRKQHSKYKNIQEIYAILEKEYGLTLPQFGSSLNILSWFEEKIKESNENKNAEEKVKLLFLKVEYEKWIDITKRETQLSLKESLLDDSLTIEDYIEIMNEC